jgi:hypothetical protein
MKKAFNIGLGLILGLTAGEIIIYAVTDTLKKFLRKHANDDKYMDGLKTKNPDLYERLLKYRED